uniref:Uncharacterized protein n=1 Tax=Chromera velia CCMP2878 TaxID=1169474 RepID=A0A0G4F826_9ALVE|eukprot:Cvel_15485.t1-p1 / transcript=Cvel_15485.t1 / gene=Cvel_15485 / organism=Chromera_velia_CCMP2878 / gene_product=hypothetical protein / transcript_product=hypothetical protein / location=Cvel_scaffold1148:46118-47964(+) / protein_length=370 / sequence_SO=supercontig / SO=protein_coding / is_pseudo=false
MKRYGPCEYERRNPVRGSQGDPWDYSADDTYQQRSPHRGGRVTIPDPPLYFGRTPLPNQRIPLEVIPPPPAPPKNFKSPPKKLPSNSLYDAPPYSKSQDSSPPNYPNPDRGHRTSRDGVPQVPELRPDAQRLGNRCAYISDLPNKATFPPYRPSTSPPQQTTAVSPFSFRPTARSPTPNPEPQRGQRTRSPPRDEPKTILKSPSGARSPSPKHNVRFPSPASPRHSPPRGPFPQPRGGWMTEEDWYAAMARPRTANFRASPPRPPSPVPYAAAVPMTAAPARESPEARAVPASDPFGLRERPTSPSNIAPARRASPPTRYAPPVQSAPSPRPRGALPSQAAGARGTARKSSSPFQIALNVRNGALTLERY